MRVVRKMISIIITIVLISSMIIGNITIVLAQNSDSTVDISRLEDLYNECKEVERGTYTHGSWGYFQDALGLTHYTLYGPEEITAEAIDFAYDYLSISYSWLDEHDGSEPEPDRTVLEEAYNNYKNIEQGDYNEVSWGRFIDALEEAYGMLYEYEYINQDHVDFVLDNLVYAYERLEEGEPDFTELESAFYQLKDVQKGDYNLGSWSWFKQDLNYIEDILTIQHERDRTTQSEIDYLLAELLTSYNNLEIGEADFTELEDLFESFNEEYKTANPEELFTDLDDIELFEYIMYYIPDYLADRQYATQRETDELITTIQELQKRLTSIDDEEPKEEENNTPDPEGDGDSGKEEGNVPDPEGDGDSKKEEGNVPDPEGDGDSEKEEGNVPDPEGDGDSGKEEGNVPDLEGDGDSGKEESNVPDPENDSGSGKGENNAPRPKGDSGSGEEADNHLDMDRNSRETAQEYISGNVLPKTATNNYNMMILGLILVVEGVFLYVYFNFISFLRRRFNLF